MSARTSDRNTTPADAYEADAFRPLSMAKSERRVHRRHDLEDMAVRIDRFEDLATSAKTFGQLVDLSAGGIRIRTSQANVQPAQQIRVRITLPDYAGICPFVAKSADGAEPKREWVGWMSVARVRPMGNGCMEVAGRLVDMDEMDRGMLGLYLSTQPLAA